MAPFSSGPFSKDVQKLSSLEKRLSEQEDSMTKQATAMTELSESVKQLLFSLFVPPSGESLNSSDVGKAKVSTPCTSSETFPNIDKSTGFIPYEDPVLPPLYAAPRSNPYLDYIYQR